MADKKTHRGEDGLLYDEDGHLVYTGQSPLHEEEDRGRAQDEPPTDDA